MSTDFAPTHRTNRSIGKIKSGSPIRVAKYDDRGFFSDLLGQLGARDHAIEYQYHGKDVKFWDSRSDTVQGKIVLPDDYVISDGDHFETSNTDSGWDLLPVGSPEGVTFSAWGDDLYTLRGDSGAEIKFTAKQLHDLVASIQEKVPEPSPIKDAMFIWGTPSNGPREPLVRDGDSWYDCTNVEYTEGEVLELFTDLVVIR